jgi:hypothetical protein
MSSDLESRERMFKVLVAAVQDGKIRRAAIKTEGRRENLCWLT